MFLWCGTIICAFVCVLDRLVYIKKFYCDLKIRNLSICAVNDAVLCVLAPILEGMSRRGLVLCQSSRVVCSICSMCFVFANIKVKTNKSGSENITVD